MEVDYIKNGNFSHQVSAWVIAQKCKQVLSAQACSTDVIPEPALCRMQGDTGPNARIESIFYAIL